MFQSLVRSNYLFHFRAEVFFQANGFSICQKWNWCKRTDQSNAVLRITFWPKYFSRQSPILQLEKTTLKYGKTEKRILAEGLFFHSDLSRRAQLKAIPSSRIPSKVSVRPVGFHFIIRTFSAITDSRSTTVVKRDLTWLTIRLYYPRLCVLSPSSITKVRPTMMLPTVTKFHFRWTYRLP